MEPKYIYIVQHNDLSIRRKEVDHVSKSFYTPAGQKRREALFTNYTSAYRSIWEAEAEALRRAEAEVTIKRRSMDTALEQLDRVRASIGGTHRFEE